MNTINGKRFDVIIMHHWKRAKEAEALATQVARGGPGGWYEAPRIITDGLHEAPSMHGLLRTWAAILDALDPQSDYTIILQDDVEVCLDFLRTCETLTRVVPDQAIGLYYPRKPPRHRGRGEPMNEHWLCGGPFAFWGQSTFMPTRILLEYRAWDRANLVQWYDPEILHPADDRRLEAFFFHTNRSVWLTIPSLIDHRAPSHSLIGFNRPDRVASQFIGPNVSGLTVDWRMVGRVPRTSFKTWAKWQEQHPHAYIGKP